MLNIVNGIVVLKAFDTFVADFLITPIILISNESHIIGQ
jgi:hypothetical protein